MGIFGTDGIRGVANSELTPELALKVASAAVRALPADGHPRAVVGRDPRLSSDMLDAAVCAGLASAGADVLRAGVLPTPAIAYLTAELNADLGVMLSASHNPMPDNGVKIFARGGHKLPDETEERIEAILDTPWHRPTGTDVGRIVDLTDGGEQYITHLLSAINRPFDGLTVVVDCAHGAASIVAPAVYSRAGARVIAIGAQPDGHNINAGVGSTHIDHLRAAMSEHGADIGLAHDGDADRCLAVDAHGVEIDGDQIMAILALALHERGELASDTVVATVMSNLGLHITMREHGIRLITTAVGDRYVLEELRNRGFSFGGEQSGHIIFADHATTGDGLLTGAMLLARMAETGRSLTELASIMRRLPQVLLNVPVPDKSVTQSATVAAAVQVAESELGETGRILLRPSGTEPLVRVMVEAPTQQQAGHVADSIADAVRMAGS